MQSSIVAGCPPALLNKAQNGKVLQAAIVGAGKATVLEAARAAFDQGLIEPVLVGPLTETRAAAESIGWDVSGFRAEAAGDQQEAAEMSVALASRGEADIIVKGSVKTDILMRTVVDRNAGLRTDRLMSHVFLMTDASNDRALFISDAVLNVLPTVPKKARILDNLISLMKSLGYVRPKIALLSASEAELDSMPSTLDAATLTAEARAGRFPDAIVDGPLAFDLAVSEAAADIKGCNSEVAGAADAVLVPNIETGNALFKMMVHYMGASAAGVVLGARVPVVVTSRADSAASRLASVALASIHANSGH